MNDYTHFYSSTLRHFGPDNSGISDGKEDFRVSLRFSEVHVQKNLGVDIFFLCTPEYLRDFSKLFFLFRVISQLYCVKNYLNYSHMGNQ